MKMLSLLVFAVACASASLIPSNATGANGYHISLETLGASYPGYGFHDLWLDTFSGIWGATQNYTISWGPEQGKLFTKTDGWFIDSVDSTITHVWIEFQGAVNFFPTSWGGNGQNQAFIEHVRFIPYNFTLLTSTLSLYQNGALVTSHTQNENIVWTYPQYSAPSGAPYYGRIPNLAPTTGSPTINKVRYEMTVRSLADEAPCPTACGFSICGSGDGTVTVEVTSSWTGGMCGNIKINNPSTSTAKSWNLLLSFSSPATLSSSWNGQFCGANGSGASTLYKISPPTWGATPISGGATDTSVGFCASFSGSSITATAKSKLTY